MGFVLADGSGGGGGAVLGRDVSLGKDVEKSIVCCLTILENRHEILKTDLLCTVVQ